MNYLHNYHKVIKTGNYQRAFYMLWFNNTLNDLICFFFKD